MSTDCERMPVEDVCKGTDEVLHKGVVVAWEPGHAAKPVGRLQPPNGPLSSPPSATTRDSTHAFELAISHHGLSKLAQGLASLDHSP